MGRATLQVGVSILAAAIIAAACYLLLTDDHEPLAVGDLPTASAAATTTPPPLTLTPSSPTPTPSASPQASAKPTPTPTTGPRPSFVPASSVDCGNTPSFCSPTEGTLELKDDKLVTSGTTQHGGDYSAVPNTTMTTRIISDGGGDASNGDKVSKLEIVVEVRNDTNDTFVIPDREIILRVDLNGRTLHEIGTNGADFEMRPGAALTARYDIPIANDGKYSWRARTSFYEK